MVNYEDVSAIRCVVGLLNKGKCIRRIILIFLDSISFRKIPKEMRTLDAYIGVFVNIWK